VKGKIPHQEGVK